jgi:hypothetical protein
VFPTGIDRRDDLGTPDRLDVYYGMADMRIGVARLDLPERLPPDHLADARDRKVDGSIVKDQELHSVGTNNHSGDGNREQKQIKALEQSDKKDTLARSEGR